MSTHFYTIPRSLCFLPPVYSIFLVLRSARIPSALSCCNISLLALFSLVTAALGLAEVSLSSSPLAAAYTILLASLRFHLCLSVLFCIVATVPADTISPLRLAFYTTVLGLILFSAVISALIPPFLPSPSIPPLLPPLLNVLFVTLSLPLISYILLAAFPAPVRTLPRLRPIRSLPSPVTSTPSSPTSQRKAASFDLPPTFSQIQLIDAETQRLASCRQGLPRYLLAGQLCALFSSVFNICDFVLIDEPANVALETIEAAFFVAWIACVMKASYCVPAPSTTSIRLRISSPVTPLTKLPSRSRPRSRTLSSISSVPQPAEIRLSPYRPHLRPTLRILTTNLQNRTSGLRKTKGPDTPLDIEDEIDDPLGTLSADPFAPPQLGARVREPVPDQMIYQPPQTRMSAWGTLTLPLPTTMVQPIHSPSRSKKQPSRPEPPSRDMDLEYEHIHREEVLLAQRLLRRLENGVGYLTRWDGSLGRKGRG